MDELLAAAKPLLTPAFQAFGAPVTWLELVAVALSLWMVACNLRVHPLAWPLAMLSSALYAVLFADSRLYGEAGLQLVFIAVAAWGWWQWLHGTTADGQALQVRRLAPAGRWALLAVLLIAWPMLALVLDHGTDSDVPWWDAFPTAGSLIGQWLLGRKYIENWLAWLVVNAVSVALFAHKGLWLTVLLYGVFMLLSVWGWLAWRRIAAAGGAR